MVTMFAGGTGFLFVFVTFFEIAHFALQLIIGENVSRNGERSPRATLCHYVLSSARFTAWFGCRISSAESMVTVGMAPCSLWMRMRSSSSSVLPLSAE